jgi:hypothetical protein
VPDDGAAAQEPDPGDDLGGQAARVGRPAEPVGRHQGEQAGPDGQEHVGAQAGGLVVQLPLGADGAAEHGGKQQAAEEFEVAWHRSLRSRGTARC